MTELSTAGGSNLIVYDGACPLCENYVRMLRLRESIGEVSLVSSRSTHPIVQTLRDAGYDLNEGIVLVQDDRIYHGEDCMVRMALLSSPIGLFNRLNAFIFRSPRLSAALYPLLKRGRACSLWLLGREQITY